MMGPSVTNYITSFDAAIRAGVGGEKSRRISLSRAVMGQKNHYFCSNFLYVFCACKLAWAPTKRYTYTQKLTYKKVKHVEYNLHTHTHIKKTESSHLYNPYFLLTFIAGSTFWKNKKNKK